MSHRYDSQLIALRAVWVPSREGRYAYSPETKELYSFVSPGSVGRPKKMARMNESVSNQGGYSMSNGGWSTYYTIDWLGRVTQSAFQNFKKKHPIDQAVTEQSQTGSYFIIGGIKNGVPSFSSNPAKHLSEDAAWAEAQRLAGNVGGEFGVFKLVGLAEAAKVSVRKFK